MEEVNKLLIITSPFGNEYANYWSLAAKSNPVVKNGNDRFGDAEYQMVFGGEIEETSWKTIEEIINNNGYLILIHFNTQRIGRNQIEKRSFKRNDETITYYVYYYSTQKQELRGNLWSIDDNYGYSGTENDPKCPLDRLRYDIINGRSTEGSVHEIIEWVRNQTIDTDLLETKLGLLHDCLIPEIAKKVSGIKNYHLVKDIVVSENITVDAFISKFLTNTQTQEEHHEKLTILRDALLD